MFKSVDGFLKYFDGVNRRAMRDIAALPPEANGWHPPAGAGENSWSINQLVGHMAGSRLYFANAYLQNGWISLDPPETSSPGQWILALEHSAAEFRRQLEGTPDEWLERKVPMIDTPGPGLSGWRVLLMMVEHDVHHRSQIDTYAGLNGWEPPQIYGRAWEDIAKLQDAERAKHSQP